MEKDYHPSLSLLARTASSSWQQQLRHSVRLYLALGANPLVELELDSVLQKTEEELVSFLLEGEPPTDAARRQAQTFLDMAQNELLASETDVQQLLREGVPTS
ncbi:hypothetical protein QMK33_21170 [Hymenobacter sp. H14-R3]|uniref:hypothetical protein n=1 Tax=Hymenobacter sp. H14-R3 TaxID=3046308 RepID=UPI0024B8904D|nr:hypothetical protein [Hymenobacter sp. H14-R3]MDJ0367665.1 hypothetical protein [Hymenobacter sp. H14-R3]